MKTYLKHFALIDFALIAFSVTLIVAVYSCKTHKMVVTDNGWGNHKVESYKAVK